MSRYLMIFLPVVGVLSALALLTTLHYYIYTPKPITDHDVYHYNQSYLEKLQGSMGIRCEIPQLDPFSKEVKKYEGTVEEIQCPGQDWVKCYHSKCRVIDAVKKQVRDIRCTFRDILYLTDYRVTVGALTEVGGDDFYELKESDHVKVTCVGTWKEGNWFTRSRTRWSGSTLGLRGVRPPPAPYGRSRTPSVLIFGFDSVARSTFIRHMPKSWKMLKQIGSTVMEGYNVVGDGTDHALLPILTGHTDLELPSAARLMRGAREALTFDTDSFIFSKLKQDGYRTAYFEDRPDIDTFTFRYNGFSRQPADHYLRALLMWDWFDTTPLLYYTGTMMPTYCLGDTPQFKVMINMTQQLLELGGKKFIFTFIVGLTHDKDWLSNADDDMAALLHGLLLRTEDTLIIVMADHGPRFSEVRNTVQGRLEHRLPLLAIRLPDQVTRERPHAQRALEANARALTTPHDLHATILDVLDMRQHWNPYKVQGAAIPRALTMLQLIPRNRSCSEAGIEPHWCACVAWQNVSADDPMFRKPARALMEYINSLLTTVGDLCVPRTLNSTSWVFRQPNSPLTLSGDLYANKSYQIKIVAEPGGAMFEATMTYSVKEDKFTVDARDISRSNAYRHEPACISNTHPHLNPYCYCRGTHTAHQPYNLTGG